MGQVLARSCAVHFIPSPRWSHRHQGGSHGPSRSYACPLPSPALRDSETLAFQEVVCGLLLRPGLWSLLTTWQCTASRLLSTVGQACPHWAASPTALHSRSQQHREPGLKLLRCLGGMTEGRDWGLRDSTVSQAGHYQNLLEQGHTTSSLCLLSSAPQTPAYTES